MAKVLILMLGKGQAKLQGKEKVTYNDAFYIKPEEEEKVIETPFVGYAILKLFKDYVFDKIYILGTNDSMWDVLYLYCSDKNNTYDDDFDTYGEISKEVKKRQVSKESLKLVGENFTKLTSIKTDCQTIKIGKDIDEIRTIFNQLLSIPEKEDVVSIDITHGLRFQPFISLLSLFYLQKAKNISIEHIFYGGLELSSEYPCFDELGNPIKIKIYGRLRQKGLSPIIQLDPILEYIKWIDAASAFKDYGDIKPLAALLPNETKLNEAAENLKASYQLNLVGEISKSAKNFNSHLNNISFGEDNYEPFKVIKETISEFPQKLSNKGAADWETYLLIAKRNYDNGLLGLSILSAWEAVIARFKIPYAADLSTNDFSNYKIIGKIIRNANFFRFYKNTPFKDFPDKMKELSKFRNAIAHAEDSTSFNLAEIKTNFPKILKFLTKNLGSYIINDINTNIIFTDYIDKKNKK